ncbi:hypothetical protein [Endozoicomonas ascidiicola]|uniref:hypothetical protein n=1 Tax=Endozoicomonas ascidiicola TaxID=1698521 RepID=UPI0008342452|nr:hypothetical protein [Endozoicomonas ascidiicola]
MFHSDIHSDNLFILDDGMISFIDLESFDYFQCEQSSSFIIMCAHFWSAEIEKAIDFLEYRRLVADIAITFFLANNEDMEIFDFFAKSKASSLVRKARGDFISGNLSQSSFLNRLRKQEEIKSIDSKACAH